MKPVGSGMRPGMFFALCAGVAALVLLSLPGNGAALTDDSVCSQVKIEILQELTLERQAFDAHMRIHNGLDGIAIENVKVEVSFADADGKVVRATSDPDDTSALFFIRLDSMENIDDVAGGGRVAGGSTADIHWLIIPAPGAARGASVGTPYSVGATLEYTLGGEPHTTTVTPDSITVKPMPEMTLDYFIPKDVFGDDAFTSPVEPPVPFSLGLRIKNSGSGAAKDLKVDSAQPKIVDNAQGLPVNFVITGSEVNGSPVNPSLLVSFGDIAAQSCGTARWIMTCSLSGRFVQFSAEFTHSDDLGGTLTSLIEEVHTHILVRDVLSDLPGRDTVKDFLALDGAILRLYESDGTEWEVMDRSGSSGLDPAAESGSVYSLHVPATAGFFYVDLPDPTNGSGTISLVTRSDGKRLKTENVWQTKTRSGSMPWDHRLRLLDANSDGAQSVVFYTVVFNGSAPQNSPPGWKDLAEKHGTEGTPLVFSVTAEDPDGNALTLSAAPLPALAGFEDLGNGSGLFRWTPASGQAGRYEVSFTASDGKLSQTDPVTVTICTPEDSDCDAMADAWERKYFGGLHRDGTGDLDGDGLTDLQEFLRESDPTASAVPPAPVIVSPASGSETDLIRPELSVQNSTDPDGDPVTYSFELFENAAMTLFVAAASDLPEGTETTGWVVPRDLSENCRYTWRVRAGDGLGYSDWAYGSFFVNTANDPPGLFQASSPAAGSEVSSVTPVLQVTNSVDPDDTALTVHFEVYADSTLTILAASSGPVSPGTDGKTSWTVPAALRENAWYHWKASTADPDGATAEIAPSAFFVNTANDAPKPPVIASPLPGAEVAETAASLTVTNASDADGDPLTYLFEVDTVNTFDSPALLRSGALPEGESQTLWPLSGLPDNTRLFWRVKASDGTAESPWTAGSFFVSTANDPPTRPTVKNPGDGAWVTTVTPTLEVNPAADADGDSLTYRFELYEDAALTRLLLDTDGSAPQWTTPSELSAHTWYAWRARAVDEHGLYGPWTGAASFFVNPDGIDDPPLFQWLAPANDVFIRTGAVTLAWEDQDPDSNAEIDLEAVPSDGVSPAIEIASGILEDADGVDDSITWDVSSVPEGRYALRATIRDGLTTRTVTSSVSLTADRTAPAATAEPGGGNHTGSATVTLTATEPADIHYTLDGTTPTAQSPLYAAPISITGTTTVTFVAVDRAGNTSPVRSETYTIVSEGQGKTAGRSIK